MRREEPKESHQFQGFPEAFKLLTSELEEFPCRNVSPLPLEVLLLYIPFNFLCLNELPSKVEVYISEEIAIPMFIFLILFLLKTFFLK